MTKNEYMKMLEIQLGRFSEATKQEIMEDYENHFAEAMANGKTEEEIIRELGDIQDMIDEIPEENTSEGEISGYEAGAENDFDSEYVGPYRKIVVDCKGTDAVIRTSSDDKLHTKYESRHKDADEDIMYQYENDGVLYVGVNQEKMSKRDITVGFLGLHINMPQYISSDSGRMDIEIPADLKELEITTASGDVDIKGVSGERLSLKSASGDIDIDRAKYKEITLSATSGDLELEDIDAENFGINTTSGDISVKHVSCKDLQISAMSGDVEAEKIIADQTAIATSSGDIEFSGKSLKYHGRSGSGDHDIEIEGRLEEAELVAGSGDIRLKIRDNAGAEIVSRTGSGDLDVHTKLNLEQSGDRYVAGDGSAKVSVKTGSGDVDIIL